MCLPVKTAVQKEWKYEGLQCAVTVNRLGTFCAYVRLPPGHPCYGKDYDEVNVDCHGGLTFGEAEQCVENPHEDGVGYWFGMDFGHGSDFVPGMAEDLFFSYSGDFSSYRWTLEEVVKQTEDLAKQFAERV